MELIPLCTSGGMHLIGAGPAGARTIAEVSGGSVTGERLNSTVKGNAAAYWMRTSKGGSPRSTCGWSWRPTMAR